MSGIDFYSQSQDRNSRSVKDRGSLSDVLTIISLGAGAIGTAAKTAAVNQGASSALSATTANAAKTAAVGASGTELAVSGTRNAAIAAKIAGAKNNIGKSEGLGTLYNNIIPASSSGLPSHTTETQQMLRDATQSENFKKWLGSSEGQQVNYIIPTQQRIQQMVGQAPNPQTSGGTPKGGGFLSGLGKGFLGMPQSANDTSASYYAGAMFPSILRNKLGLDTTFKAAQEQKLGDYYEFASKNAGSDPLNPLTPRPKRVNTYIPQKTQHDQAQISSFEMYVQQGMPADLAAQKAGL